MNQKLFNIRSIVQLTVFIIIIPLLPVLISSKWAWVEGYIYALINTSGFIVSRYLAARKYPGILEERAKMLKHENTESFDKILAPLAGLGGLIIVMVIGFEARLNGDIVYSLPVKIAGFFALLFGFTFGTWALVENRYFSSVVRIQSERGHQVVSTGPYSIVRHPGYAGAIIMYLGTPLLLDSLWGFIPVLFSIAVLIVRTVFEDKTLQQKLTGYQKYTKRVRYRLLPPVW